MSNFKSSPIIANDCIMFHTKDFPVEISLFENEQFGLLSVTISKTKKSKKPLYIQYTIDNSDSMTRKTNTHTRLDYVKRTLSKMFRFLVETMETEVWIHVDTFSSNFITIIDTVLLTTDNVEELIEKIMILETADMTNIELALFQSNQIMIETIKSHPEYKVVHLFLTDGEPTVGTSNINTLTNLVNPDYTHIFIGYGCDHNSKLLSNFANKTVQNKYLFVDNFEKTGVVYGEVIHSLLYSAIESATISMSPDTFIYDAKNNKWVQTLEIPSLLSEKEHIYHIKSNDPDNVYSTISGTICNQLDSSYIYVNITGQNEILSVTYSLPNLVNEKDEIVPIDLSKYIFRQRTMELLFAASKISNRMSYFDNIKNHMKDIFRKMRKYMEENQLNDDTFMKILCEDIHLSYSTLGTSEGYMLSESRNISQQYQTLYRSGSETCQRTQDQNIIGRQTNAESQLEFCDEQTQIHDVYNQIDPYDIDSYNTEFITEDIYSTQETIEITRAVSN